MGRSTWGSLLTDILGLYETAGLPLLLQVAIQGSADLSLHLALTGCSGLADLQLYHSETLELMLQRWRKLEQDFQLKNRRYDISKIPDIYDCVKYDIQHNAALQLEGTLELLGRSKALADVVIPQVWGAPRPQSPTARRR